MIKTAKKNVQLTRDLASFLVIHNKFKQKQKIIPQMRFAANEIKRVAYLTISGL